MARINLKPAIKIVTKFAKKHAPKILAGVAIVSNGVGYYLMHKSAPKVYKNLEALPENPKLWDRIKAFGPYWGALAMFVTSTGSTIGSVIMGDRIAAGLATLCSMTKAELEQMKDKLVETVGPEKAQEMNDKAYKELAERNYPKSEREIIQTENGHQLFFEPKTGQWFRSSVAAVKQAKNDYNEYIISKCWAEFDEFIQMIGCNHSEFSEYFGNNLDHLLDFTLKDEHKENYEEQYYIISYTLYGEPVAYNGKKALPFRECNASYI